MDLNDFMDTVLKTAAVLFIIVCIALLLLDVYRAPIASQDALEQCIARGFQSYTGYSRTLFGTKAYGVKCNYVDNKQEIVGTDNVAVVIK